MLSDSDLTRFLYYVEKTDDCWLWKGGVAKCGGHGIFRLHNQTRKAHRIMLEHSLQRALGVGKQANHLCRTKTCVRPDHLYEGTQAQNNADKVRDGTIPQGEGHWHSKLTAEKVLAIRRDQRSRAEIAEEYQIGLNYVSQIRMRRVWSHLPEEVPIPPVSQGT